MHLIVREHERIPVVAERERADERALTDAESELLLRTCELARIPAVVGAYRSVKFRSYCGVIQAGSLVVEVLPKIAQDDGFDRALLLRMIALASDFPLAAVDSDRLAMQGHSLLLALVRWYCDELQAQMHQGMLKQYVTAAEPLASIRGRWRPDVDALRHAGRRDRMHCEFDELTANNRYNQALKAALRRVMPLVRQSDVVSRQVAQLLGWMVDVDDVVVRAAQLDELPMNRLTQRYSRALMMARWFLSSHSPDLSNGREAGLALLFDMNALFQRTLGALIRRVLPEGLHLREEGPRRYLATDELGQRQFQMRPDLCILRGDEVLAIADAKWKLLDLSASAGQPGVAQADAYQLHAYASAYGCTRVALWYPCPGARDEPNEQGSRLYEFSGGATDEPLRQLLVQQVAMPFPVAGERWIDAMTSEVRAQLGLLLGASVGPGPGDLSLARYWAGKCPLSMSDLSQPEG
jgi:5-methylcytosine-specific restriction enzyme subunit McrC